MSKKSQKHAVRPSDVPDAEAAPLLVAAAEQEGAEVVLGAEKLLAAMAVEQEAPADLQGAMSPPDGSVRPDGTPTEILTEAQALADLAGTERPDDEEPVEAPREVAANVEHPVTTSGYDLVEAQALADLAAESDIGEEPAPYVRPQLSPAYETAAVALGMSGEINDAKDLRNGVSDVGLKLRALEALKRHNGDMALLFEKEAFPSA